MTFSLSHASPIDPIAAYVCSDQGAALARAVAERMAVDQRVVHGGGLGAAARVSTDAALAQLVLTELGNLSLDAACESITEICKTGARVIAVGERIELATYRILRNAGALDVFAFPVTPDEIISANIQPVSSTQIPDTGSPQERANIAVVGCNGGVGASLLAQNLAFYAAQAKGPALDTALIDADLRFGSQAIDLDVKDTPGLQEALSAPKRVDSTFLDATMEHIDPKLSLYSQQIYAKQDLGLLEAALPQLILSLSTKFGAVVVDLPRATLLEQPDIAEVLDAVVLMIPAGYAGVNVASRMITLLKSEAPNLRILPVLAEYRQDAKLSRKDVAKAIGQDVVAVLPRCDALVKRAHRAAKPMIISHPRSPYAKTTRSLWYMANSRAGADVRPTKPVVQRSFFKKASA